MINPRQLLAIFRLCSVILAIVTLAACQTSRPVAMDEHSADTSTLTGDTPKYEEFVSPGQDLPIDSVVDLDGNIIDLTMPDKRKLVILFATWCKDSKRAMAALNQSEILKDESIEIIAIAREESAEVVTAWRDDNDIKVPLAVDPVRSIYNQFAAAGIPRFIMVSPDNKVIRMSLAEVEDPLSLIDWQQ